MSTTVWKWKFGAIDWPGAEWKNLKSQVCLVAPSRGLPPLASSSGLVIATVKVGPAQSASGPGAVLCSFSWYCRSGLLRDPSGIWNLGPGAGGHVSEDVSEPCGTDWAPLRKLTSCPAFAA